MTEDEIFDVTPVRVDVAQADLEDLRHRLRQTRWPERETVTDWSQGVPLNYLQQLCHYWAEDYDWRTAEARLNAVPQYRTTIDGLGIHFLHGRSPHPDALPLVLTHGWPGSILEFTKVVGPLTDPEAHGGHPADAFTLVCPSLPGYGWSDKPSSPGWTVDDITLYWLTRSAASSARLYWESIRQVQEIFSRPGAETISVPTGCSVFPKENPRPSRRWAAKRFTDIRYWSEPEKGGHFAALEQPKVFVRDVRSFFRLVR